MSDLNSDKIALSLKSLYNNHIVPRLNILIAVTGSVAAIKTGEIVKGFQEFGEVQVVYTKTALQFESEVQMPNTKIWKDIDEWETWKKKGDPIRHIELRKWADIFVVVPLDANTLAKFSNGLCDNLVTCIYRAWDVQKPIVVCPAMNTEMYNKNITKKQLHSLQDEGVMVIQPVAKELACGDIGLGALPKPSIIVEQTMHYALTSIYIKIKQG